MSTNNNNQKIKIKINVRYILSLYSFFVRDLQPKSYGASNKKGLELEMGMSLLKLPNYALL